MAKTRSKAPRASTRPDRSDGSKAAENGAPSLDAPADLPPQLFVLPKDASSEARVVTLTNPATNIPNRYLVCPRAGFFEFTRVDAPRRECRSWLIAPREPRGSVVEPPSRAREVVGDRTGYVLQQASMFLATPVDPIFIILPALLQERALDGDGSDLQGAIDKRIRKLSLDDLLDNLDETSPALKAFPALDEHFRRRMHSICDVASVGDELVYRLNTRKLHRELLRKARDTASRGLPPSIEEHFVKETLTVPVAVTTARGADICNAREGGRETQQSQTESQDSGYETQRTTNQDDMDPTANNDSPCDHDANDRVAPPEVVHLLRTRVVLQYMQTAYLPPILRSEMSRLSSLRGSSTAQDHGWIDFGPLDRHLTDLQEKKSQAQALRLLSDNVSRKRTLADDEEAVQKAEAKKRKKEEEDIKRKNTSRGVKQLEKVDRSGMQKLSNFFAKAPAKS